MATTKKGLQRKSPQPTNAEISRDLAEAVRVLSAQIERLDQIETRVESAVSRLEAVARDQVRHETDVLAHRPARAR